MEQASALCDGLEEHIGISLLVPSWKQGQEIEKPWSTAESCPTGPIASETVVWLPGTVVARTAVRVLLSYGLATFSYHIPTHPILNNQLSV